MEKELKDYYYSHQSFKNQLARDPFTTVRRVLIHGEWRLFTEQITHSKKPVSLWNDLIFVGTTSENNTKYQKGI